MLLHAWPFFRTWHVYVLNMRHNCQTRYSREGGGREEGVKDLERDRATYWDRFGVEL